MASQHLSDLQISEKEQNGRSKDTNEVGVELPSGLVISLVRSLANADNYYCVH